MAIGLDLARRAARHLLQKVVPNPRSRLPRLVRLHTFAPEGCTFEVTTPVEAHRVEGYGDEEDFVRRVLEELGPNDTIYDVGACVGLISVHAGRRGAQVVAFEPDPGFRTRLQINLRLNNLLDQVQIVPWAVSDDAGEATLFTDGVAGNSPSLRQMGDRSAITVPTNSLDAAVASGEIPAPDVVKLDIEGAEILALRGMRHLLWSDLAPRAIFLELHPTFLPAFGSSPDEVDALITEAGYILDHREQRANQVHCVYRRATQP